MSEMTTDVTVDDAKMQDRLSKVLRQAEGAEEGSPEREAFMDKALALAAAYSLDLDLARSQAYDKEKVEVPVEETYQVAEVGLRKATGTDHMADLLLAITRGFDMRSILSHSNVFVYSTGFPSDHKIVSKMFAVLSVQMVAEADKGLKEGANKDWRWVPMTRTEQIPKEERAWGEDVPDTAPGYFDDFQRYAYDESEVGEETCRRVGGRDHWYKLKAPPKTRKVPVLDPITGEQAMDYREVSTVDGRVWRANFYQAFINRVRQRMIDARRRALREAGEDPDDKGSERGIVLADKKAQIDEAYDEKIRTVFGSEAKMSSYSGAQVSKFDAGAYRSGDQAGSSARLGDERDLGRG